VPGAAAAAAAAAGAGSRLRRSRRRVVSKSDGSSEEKTGRGIAPAGFSLFSANVEIQFAQVGARHERATVGDFLK
jgi:hypothetical protein